MDSLNKQFFETKEKHKKEFKKWGWILWIGLFLIFVVYLYYEINQQMENEVKTEEPEIEIHHLNKDLTKNDSLEGDKLPWTRITTKAAIKGIEQSIKNINSSDTAVDENFPLTPGPYNVPFVLKEMREFDIVGYSFSPDIPDIYTIEFRPKLDLKVTGNRITVEINIKTNKVIKVYMQPDA